MVLEESDYRRNNHTKATEKEAHLKNKRYKMHRATCDGEDISLPRKEIPLPNLVKAWNIIMYLEILFLAMVVRLGTVLMMAQASTDRSPNGFACGGGSHG